MAASQPDEAKELALVDKVELRFALADTDTKLESLLKTFLCPLLLKLASHHKSVREKVIGVCSHLSNRLGNIKLPAEALLKQLKDNAQNPLLSFYDLKFLQIGLPLLSPQERGQLFPQLVSGFARCFSETAVNGSLVLSLLLHCMRNYRFPDKYSEESNKLKATLAVSDDDAGVIVEWFSKLLLLRPGIATASHATGYPGLSDRDYNLMGASFQVKSGTTLSITEIKVAIGNALTTGIFTLEQRLLPAIYAAADPDSKISDVGEEILKRTLPEILPLSPDIVEHLYRVYFGNDHQIATPRTPIRCRILNVLGKSANAFNYPDILAKVVDQDIGDDLQSATVDKEIFKLQYEIVAFVHGASQNMDKEPLNSIRRGATTCIQALISRQLNASTSLDEIALRGRCYELIGLLSDSAFQTQNDDDATPFETIEWLFHALSAEVDKNVTVSIDQGLSHVLGVLSNQSLDLRTEQRLAEFLLTWLKRSGAAAGEDVDMDRDLRKAALETRNARSVLSAVLRFANRCLPYANTIARYIDLYVLGSSDSHELVEEAKRGLDIYRYYMFQQSVFSAEPASSGPSGPEQKCTFPDFSQLVDFIFTVQDTVAQSHAILPHAVSYCWQALVWSALRANESIPDITSDWERKLEVGATEDPQVRKIIQQRLNALASKETSDDEPLLQLWIAAKAGLTGVRIEKNIICAQIVVQLATLSPAKFITSIAPTYKMLQTLITVNDQNLRGYACHAFGLLASDSSISSSTVQTILDQLLEQAQQWETAVGALANKVQGAILSVAYLISRRSFRSRNTETLQVSISQFVSLLKNIAMAGSDTTLLNTAYTALSQLAIYNVIRCEQFSVDEDNSKLLEQISEEAKKGNERAITALGDLSLVVNEEENGKVMDELIQMFYSLHEIRQAETQFAVGEAYSIVALGWSSRAMAIKFDLLQETEPKGLERSVAPKKIIDQTLEGMKNTKPALKKASVIWAMSLVQFGSNSEYVQTRLREFQNSFKRCLSDRDDLVQEAASRGLGLVYKAGSRDLKDDLVRDLIGSFSSNKADISGSVTEDTQLFEPGALPTGEGSVSTYKDIMSLASEVGDSSLVYRFMSLASSNAIWSSRAAFGRFGLTEVFSDSSVDDYLASNPKLYPKLFRYRFDPNTNVRRAMNDIWKALVRDPATAVNNNFEAIIEDLLKSILDREWRVRQASCAAIADLVQGRKLDQVQPYVDRIWSLGYKVLDDIKSSVRTAAAGLARVMTSILLRTVETSDSPRAAREQLKSVLPFLMSPSGLESTSQDVQVHSLLTLIDIIKKARAETIRPFVPGIVEQLLALLSSFGQEKLDYVRMNAANFKISESEVDDIRLSAVRSSPLMEAIERCLDSLDDESLKALIPRIESALRTAIGMPSKVGCSRLLVSLSVRKSFLFRPFSGHFLALLEKFVRDRNETVSSSYAASMGYLARGASDEQVLRTAKFAQKLYFGDEERDRHTAGDIIHALAKHAPDRFSATAASFLPLAYFARHDENEDVRHLFSEIWTDNTGGPRAASLYLNEILEFVDAHLDSKRWNVKHAAALSLADAVQAVADTKGTISEAEAAAIWPGLKKALSEKSWDQKDQVLERGFVTFVEKGQSFWSTNSDVGVELDKIALREAKRRNREYKPAALLALGRLAKAKQDAALSQRAIAVLSDALAEESTDNEGEEGERAKDKGNRMEIDGATNRSTSRLRERIYDAAATALYASITPTVDVDDAPETGRATVASRQGTAQPSPPAHAHVQRPRAPLTMGRPAPYNVRLLMRFLLLTGAGRAPDTDYSSMVTDVLDALGRTFFPHLTSTSPDSTSAMVHSIPALQALYKSTRLFLKASCAISDSPIRARAGGTGATNPDALRQRFADLLLADSPLPVVMPDAVRTARAEAILALAKLCHLSGDGTCLGGSRINDWISAEKAPSIRKTLEQARVEALSSSSSPR